MEWKKKICKSEMKMSDKIPTFNLLRPLNACIAWQNNQYLFSNWWWITASLCSEVFNIHEFIKINIHKSNK